jgi:hypothetical protein
MVAAVAIAGRRIERDLHDGAQQHLVSHLFFPLSTVHIFGNGWPG